ncbi:MAG: SIMPL domain-containing protein [Acidobacteria bacterium]|nr:SIMPL domain-containing protein [Acidobacteriota bacterium]
MRSAAMAMTLILAVSCAYGQASTDPATTPARGERNTISVTGESTLSLEPDMVTFTVGVQTMADTVNGAVSESNRRTEAVINALLAAGADRSEIQTRNFSVWPQMDYGNEGARRRTPSIVGYQVSNEIVVRKRDPAVAGRLLQAAIDAGANTGGGLQFIVSDPGEGDDEGLTRAYADARRKALLLAEAAGRRLGATLSITEGAITPPRPGVMAVEARMSADSSVPIESGRQQKAYMVSVVFALE